MHQRLLSIMDISLSTFYSGNLTFLGVLLASNRIVICPECNKEIEVRSDFAHLTLNNHISKEHRG